MTEVLHIPLGVNEGDEIQVWTYETGQVVTQRMLNGKLFDVSGPQESIYTGRYEFPNSETFAIDFDSGVLAR